MSTHISAGLAARRVVSRSRSRRGAPQGRLPRERVRQGAGDRLRKVAGPGELRIVAAGIDQHRVGTEHLGQKFIISRAAASPSGPVAQTYTIASVNRSGRAPFQPARWVPAKG